MANLEGKQLGACQIIRQLSAGGMGDVYLAEQQGLGRQVAVKVLRWPDGEMLAPEARAQAVAHFTQEARAIAALEHPNILPIYDFGEQDGIYFLVMQYIANGSLADLMSSPTTVQQLRTPISPAHALPIIAAAASALQFAHDHHIMHLDIKPHNLLIKILSTGEASGPLTANALQFHTFLNDFGLARLMTWTSLQSDAYGTPLYTAPEQYHKRPVPASDQYALACVALQLLTGSPPFQGDIAALHHQHLTESAPLATSLNPALPPSVNPIFMTALAKDPAQRFASVQAFADALNQCFVTASLPQSFALPVAAPPLAMSRPILAPGGTATPPASGGYTFPTPVGRSLAPLPGAIPPLAPSGAPLFMPDAPPSPLPKQAGKFRLPGKSWLFAVIGLVVIASIFSGLFFAHRPQAVSKPITTLWKFATGGSITSSPIIAGSTIYVTSHDGILYALSLSNGQQLWDFTTRGPITSAPAVDAQGNVYVASGDGEVYSLNSSGAKRWNFTTTSGFVAAPVIVGAVVYVGANNHLLYALNTNTGKPIWTFTAQASIYGNVTVINQTIYFGAADKAIYALRLNGTLLWRFPTHDIVAGTPLVQAGVVYIGSEDHALYALDATTGKQNWTFPTGNSIDSLPAANASDLFFGGDDGNLYAVNLVSGTQLWAYSAGSAIHSNPALAGNLVVAGTASGDLVVVDSASGKLRARAHIGEFIYSSPIIHQGIVFVGSGHQLVALKVAALS